MADVSRVARLSRPTVYKYFPDRAALLSAVVGHGIVAHDNDVIEAMSMQDSLDRQARRGCDRVEGMDPRGPAALLHHRRGARPVSGEIR